MYEPINEKVFEVAGRDLDEWEDFYPEYKEMIPKHIPEALVNYVLIKSYVDENYAGNTATMRLHSVITYHLVQ